MALIKSQKNKLKNKKNFKVKNKEKEKRYNHNVLGYRFSRRNICPLLDTEKRIAIIYDHIIHRLNIKQLIKDYQVNYSTIRHILAQYLLYGRTEVRKFKTLKRPRSSKRTQHLAEKTLNLSKKRLGSSNGSRSSRSKGSKGDMEASGGSKNTQKSTGSANNKHSLD